jgi:hypothetical protein
MMHLSGLGIILDTIRAGGEAIIEAGSTLLDGLVSYWGLNEVSGTRYDAVGDNDLTDNNTVGAVLRGPEGTVADFVAANNESLTRAGFTFTAPAGWTVAGWALRAADNSLYGSPLSVGGSDFIFVYAGNSCYFGAAGVQVNLPEGLPSQDAWHFYVAWMDPATGKAYLSVDDAAPGSGDYSSYAVPNGLLDFGGWGGWRWGGKVGETGFWSRVLTADERTSLFARGNGKSYADLTTAEKVGLVSYWNLDEVSGDRADSHGDNDLTDNNTVGSVINAGDAMDGGAASFVAANSEYLSLGDTVLPESFTVSAWFKYSSASDTYPIIFYAADSWYSSVQIAVYGGNAGGDVRVLIGDGLGGYQQGVITAPASLYDGWHFIVAGYDITDRKAFIQLDGGAEVKSAALVTDRYASPTPVWIGGGQVGDTPNRMSGVVDEVAIWDRVLTADERTELFAAGAGKFYPFA